MIPVLINNPLFRGITPEKLSANLEEISFHTRSYKKGEILARQGDVCNRLVILTKGSVRGEILPTTHGLYPTSSFSCLSRLSGRRLLLIYFAYISSNNSYISPSTDRNRN